MENMSINSLLEQWEQKEKDRLIEQYIMGRKKLYGIYMPVMFVITVGALVGLGIMVGATIQQIFKIHVLFGVGLFVLSALPLMFMNSKSRIINAVMKRLKKEQNNVLQTEEDKQAFAKDMLENGNDDMYAFVQSNCMMRVLFGKRFILQKHINYYTLVDTQKVEALSLASFSYGRGAGLHIQYHINFHYPSSGKKLSIFDNNIKDMCFDWDGNRDEVFNRIKNTYNIPVIQE